MQGLAHEDDSLIVILIVNPVIVSHRGREAVIDMQDQAAVPNGLNVLRHGCGIQAAIAACAPPAVKKISPDFRRGSSFDC
jgi:hypothetical protein